MKTSPLKSISSTGIHLGGPPIAPSEFSASGHLPRARLLAAWGQASDRQLTVVHAPLGFGKTTLLRQMKQTWLDAGGICLHLDGDLSRQGASLVELLQGNAEKSFAGQLNSRSIMSRHKPEMQETIASIASLLGEGTPPCLVLIDDYDRLNSADNNEALHLCLKAFPPQARFVLASRSRASGLRSEIASSMLEIGPNALRLTPSEIAEVLEAPENGPRVEQVSKWTGGWPLAVNLTQPLMALADPDGADLADLVGNNRADIAGILAEEVLKSLPRQHHEVMLKTSLLDRFHPDLLIEALGVSHSWQTCEELEREHFLITRQGDTDWYEVHPFIQRVAYRRLRAMPNVDMKDLRVRSAEWLNRKGDLFAALSLAVTAGAFDEAVQMLLSAGGVFLALRKGFDCLRHALSLLPHHIRQGVERLVLADAIVLSREGRFALASDLVERVRNRVHALAGQSIDADLRRDLAYAQVTIAWLTGTVADEHAVAELQHALDQSDAGEFWLMGPVHHRLATTQFRAGDLHKALEHAGMAHHYYDAGRAPHAMAHVDLLIGAIKLEAGQTAEAIKQYHHSLDRFSGDTAFCARGRAVANAMLAEAYAEIDQFAFAQRHFEDGVTILEGGETVYEYKIAAAHAQCLITMKTTGTDVAIYQLRRHEEVAAQRDLPDIGRFMGLRRLQIELTSNDALDRVSTNAALSARLQSDHSAYSRRERDMIDTIRALMALTDGAEAEVLKDLESKLHACAQAGRRRTELQLHLLVCKLHDAMGHPALALSALGRAVAISAKTGLIRPFDELGPAGPKLLKRLIAVGIDSLDDDELDILGALVARDPIISEGHNSLTDRELDVFRLVGEGHSNKLIARDLDVSPDTVRFHLKNVYEKLGTSDRKLIRRLARVG